MFTTLFFWLMTQQDRLPQVPVAMIPPSWWTPPFNCEPIWTPFSLTCLCWTILWQQQGKQLMYQVNSQSRYSIRKSPVQLGVLLGGWAPESLTLQQPNPAPSTPASKDLSSFLMYLTLFPYHVLPDCTRELKPQFIQSPSVKKVYVCVYVAFVITLLEMCWSSCCVCQSQYLRRILKCT